jgi:hypothetical protein
MSDYGAVEGRRDETTTFRRMKPLPIKVPLPEKPVLLGGNSLSEDLHEKALKEWKNKVNQAILENIPDGYYMKSCEVKEVKIVETFAEITLEKL